MQDQVINIFPFLQRSGESLQKAFRTHAIRMRLKQGEFIWMNDNQCTALPLVLSGTARVYKTSQNGVEITLYRIEPGQTCIMTASCVLSDRNFPAFAVAETDLEAYAIPTSIFRGWIQEHPEWRTYVFDLLATRLSAVMEIVEEVAFQRVDVRLASYLLNADDSGGKAIKKTHEAIAADLNTSREVVSRMLKEFENERHISLSPGSVVVDDRDSLHIRAKKL